MKLTTTSDKNESGLLETANVDAHSLDDPSEDANDQSQATSRVCYHCGTNCNGSNFNSGEKFFCCRGCLTVFELLTENGLNDFYQLSETAGVRVRAQTENEQFKYLDAPSVRERLVLFADQNLTRVSFRIPAIHCIACVWLLENLFRLKPGIGQSQVNFPNKEVMIGFETGKVLLSEVVELLGKLGYEPELKFSDLETASRKPLGRTLWLQLGIAGFAFGNIMFFSIASYLGLDSFSGPGFKRLFGWLSLVLATPVVVFSARDYWRASVISLKQKLLTIDVPIAAGIAAIYLQSLYEVASGFGEGYFDSLTGLIFFLLCGKWFQQKTFDRLAFDRDYRSFFPLSVNRSTAEGEERVSLSEIAVGDRLTVRNSEIIPADARLVAGPALIDYSFVTGESEPVEKQAGDYLYAGGRQMGGSIQVEIMKAVSQSYLASLWNQEAFRKDNGSSLDTLTNRYSQRFTRIIIAVALGAAIYWGFTKSSLALKSFTSVLIVACPCALALAAPFTLGTALRVLGRRQIFLKGPQVLESLARVNALVFDKTGTLTAAGAVHFEGAALSSTEQTSLFSLARQSTHPYCVRIAEAIAGNHFEPVRSFLEVAGCGVEGDVAGRTIWMGSTGWLAFRKVTVPRLGKTGSVVHVAMNGQYRGAFILDGALRVEADTMIRNLGKEYGLALLSGDNDKELGRFTKIFGTEAKLHFNQSPLDKLNYVQNLQEEGKTVLMLGDGLNDAGALKQSNVGVAVVENVSAFSPASDVIMAAAMVPQLGSLLRFSKGAVRIVRLSFTISSIYNVIGISIAARGLLSPIVCAILMPLSSVSVVAFACGATTWWARRCGLGKPTNLEVKP
ncbi:MAG: hypothetical protein JWM16_3516 [Verrucomicrobiales bacterium]|nr:hypothetical protein [Verrucomicrobiales bacterium]